MATEGDGPTYGAHGVWSQPEGKLGDEPEDGGAEPQVRGKMTYGMDMPPVRSTIASRAPKGAPAVAKSADYSRVRSGMSLEAASAAAAVQAQLPSLFKEGSLKALAPVQKSTTNGYLEVFPRNSSRKPALLQQLESLLSEKLRLSDKLSESPGRKGGLPTIPDPAGSSLHLEAYRQTFEAFINAFSTYRPLLTRIKEQYDSALDGALRSEHENVHLRSELNAMEQRRQRAVDQARAETNAAAATTRGELSSRLQEAEARAAEAEKRAAAARAEADAALAELAKTRAELEETAAENQSLKTHLLEEASWSSKPLSGTIEKMQVGPVPSNFNRKDVEVEEKPVSDGISSDPTKPGMS